MSLCLNKGVENELRALPGNNVCCDCDAKLPQWASVSFGVFMCLECSGRHRALGVHISFVRSVSMDSWSDKQIKMMRCGGNDKCIAFLKQYGVPKDMPIPQKYNTPAALLYRDRMSAEVEGRPLPTELPAAYASTAGAANQAQGTDPLPGETEAQYVARQRKLQEEARERMRQKFGASNGLSSSGMMAGIGSNPNYNPDQQGAAGGLDLSEAGQRAYSLLSSSFALIGETVSKTAETYNSNPGSANTSSKQLYGSGPPPAPQPSKTWSLLSSGAADLWKQAAVATSDIVGIITAPVDEEAELRFPRPPMAPATSSSNGNASSSNNGSGNNSTSNNTSSKPPSGRGGGSGAAPRSNESWDDLDDLLSGSGGKSDKGLDYHGSASNGSNNNNRSAASVGGSSGRTSESYQSEVPTRQVAGLKLTDPSSSKKIGLGSSGNSNNSVNSIAEVGRSTPPSSTAGKTSPLVGTPGGVKATTGAASGKHTAAPSPVGDDFFATFGM